MKLKLTHLPPQTNLFFMKRIFIDSYKTIEECYTVIFQELSDFEMSIIFNIFTAKLIYILICPQQSTV